MKTLHLSASGRPDPGRLFTADGRSDQGLQKYQVGLSGQFDIGIRVDDQRHGESGFAEQSGIICEIGFREKSVGFVPQFEIKKLGGLHCKKFTGSG